MVVNHVRIIDYSSLDLHLPNDSEIFSYTASYCDSVHRQILLYCTKFCSLVLTLQRFKDPHKNDAISCSHPSYLVVLVKSMAI